jgi:Raf kinase inhibitor-like YbhB/YbcL family protein
MAFVLSSPSFTHEGEIPAKYTCEGNDVSPTLSWSGVPEGTKRLALVVDDPDAPDPQAPKTVWVHWVLYNLPAETDSLAEGISSDALPDATGEGRNDWGETGYRGPCPPIGRHRYFHKLYALDTVLPDLGSPTKQELEEAMKGHILARAEIMGTYEKGA